MPLATLLRIGVLVFLFGFFMGFAQDVPLAFGVANSSSSSKELGYTMLEDGREMFFTAQLTNKDCLIHL